LIREQACLEELFDEICQIVMQGGFVDVVFREQKPQHDIRNMVLGQELPDASPGCIQAEDFLTGQIQKNGLSINHPQSDLRGRPEILVEQITHRKHARGASEWEQVGEPPAESDR
jgi:hypothetical protein